MIPTPAICISTTELEIWMISLDGFLRANTMAMLSKPRSWDLQIGDTEFYRAILFWRMFPLSTSHTPAFQKTSIAEWL